MDLGLRDRVVLITGGGGGSGPTLGRAFAAEGALVALHHRAGSPSAVRAEEAAAGIVAAGGRAIAVGADLRSTADTTAMIERVEAELGAVGVLVTATSGYASGQFTEIADDAWESIVEDALGATFRACRAVVPGMQAAGWGRIVTIAARSGLAGVARSAHYAAAKEAGALGRDAALGRPERQGRAPPR